MKISAVLSVHACTVVTCGLCILAPASAQAQSGGAPITNPAQVVYLTPDYASGGSGTTGIAVADVNNDGKPDIVLANQCADSTCATGSVSVLLGNGNGTFQAPVSYLSGGYHAASVVIKDMNHDGIPDIIVSNACEDSSCSTTGNVAVLLGTGGGLFGAAVASSSGGQTAGAIAVADVNGDSVPDVVVCNGNSVGLLFGVGNGTFQTVQALSGMGGASGVAIADMNNDGIPDLVFAAGEVYVFLGAGGGAFQEGQGYPTGAVSTAQGVAVAKLTGNGIPDVVIANTCDYNIGCNGVAYASPGSLVVLAGNGDGTLQEPQEPVGKNVPGSPSSVVLADVNGDGKLDAVMVTSQGIAVALGNGDGTFQSPRPFQTGGQPSQQVAVLDVNGDGKPDVLAANLCDSAGCATGSAGVLLGNGEGVFEAPGVLTLVECNSGGTSIDAGDVLGDGVQGLFVLNRIPGCANDPTGGSNVAIYLGNGDGTFQTGTYWDPYTFTGALLEDGIGLTSLAVGDLTGQGLPDFITTYARDTDQGGGGATEEWGDFYVGLNISNEPGKLPMPCPEAAISCGFQQGPLTLVGLDTTSSVALGDVNGDGKLDAVFGNLATQDPFVQQGSWIAIYLGNGEGGFQGTPTTINLETVPALSYPAPAQAVTLADVNGDGKLDIIGVGGTTTGGSVGVLLGNGDGTFQQAVIYPTGGTAAFGVTAADVNGDGKPDLIIEDRYGLVSVLLNNGDGTFKAATTYPVNSIANLVIVTPFNLQVGVADFNGDGFPDIVTDSGSLLLGNGDGTFQPALNLGTYGSGVAVVDLNGDGAPDIVIGNTLNNSMTIYMNRTNFPQIAVAAATGTYGTTTTLTATVTFEGAPLSGQPVSFTLNGDAVGDATTNAAGVATLAGISLSGIDAGAYTKAVIASIAVSTTHPEQTGTASLTVSPAAQTISFPAPPNTSYGAPSFTVDATSTSGITVTLAVAGQCTLDGDIVSVTGAGSCTITASQAGTENYTAAANVVNVVQISKAETITALASEASPIPVGQPATFYAFVDPVLGENTLTGSIVFKSGSTVLGTVPVSSNQAIFTTSSLAAGSHMITAAYSGDTNGLASTSAAMTQVVIQPSSTTTALTSNLNPSVTTQAVTLTASIHANSAVPTLTGTVTFFDGTTELATVSVSGGKATFKTSSLALGTHSITAAYSGESYAMASTSAVLNQVVNEAATATELTSNHNPSVTTEAVTLTASVHPLAGTAKLTGTVTFLDGATVLASVPLSAEKATFTTSTLALGTHSITAAYSGDSNGLASTSAVLTQVVNEATTATTLTSNHNPSVTNQAVTLTASVRPLAGTAKLTGTVTFLDGTTVLATVPLTAEKAILTTSTMALGAHSITAAYSGDSNGLASTSAVLTQVVN
jgi:hypothetical protein